MLSMFLHTLRLVQQALLAVWIALAIHLHMLFNYLSVITIACVRETRIGHKYVTI